MSERTSGIYRLITIPALYAGFQAALGATGARRRIRDELLPDIAGKRILEIGCGPGTWAPLLHAAESYTGVDWNPGHIARAQAAHGSPTRRFICGDIADPLVLGADATFDVVMAMGILHHLDDPTALGVIERIAGRLTGSAGGRFVGVEPVFHERQHPFAAWMKRRDSGQDIRTEEGYRALLAQGFGQVEIRVVTNYLRVPYSHCLLTGRDPR